MRVIRLGKDALPGVNAGSGGYHLLRSYGLDRSEIQAVGSRIYKSQLYIHDDAAPHSLPELNAIQENAVSAALRKFREDESKIIHHAIQEKGIEVSLKELQEELRQYRRLERQFGWRDTHFRELKGRADENLGRIKQLEQMDSRMLRPDNALSFLTLPIDIQEAILRHYEPSHDVPLSRFVRCINQHGIDAAALAQGLRQGRTIIEIVHQNKKKVDRPTKDPAPVEKETARKTPPKPIEEQPGQTIDVFFRKIEAALEHGKYDGLRELAKKLESPHLITKEEAQEYRRKYPDSNAERIAARHAVEMANLEGEHGIKESDLSEMARAVDQNHVTPQQAIDLNNVKNHAIRLGKVKARTTIRDVANSFRESHTQKEVHPLVQAARDLLPSARFNALKNHFKP